MNCEEFVENIKNFIACHPSIYDIVNNEPKPGEYIRTTDGYIRRLKFVNTDANIITRRGKYILDVPRKNCSSIARNKIVKHSSNIIDLVEENDAIKFWYEKERICNVYKTSNGNLCVWNGFEDVPIKHIHIKSIVTKEQIAAVEYKLDN